MKDNPVSEGDLFATIYTALGINHRAKHYHGMRPVWLTPEGAKPVKELMLTCPTLAKPALAWNLPWDADWVTAVAFLGSSRRVAAGNNLGQILLWELPEKAGGDAPKPLARSTATPT